jgi:RNA polymerase sigma-70 factor, ECF subfamily
MGQRTTKTKPNRPVTTTGAGGERRHAVWTIGAEELACQARQGSSAAFAELVDRFGGRLLMYLRHKTGNWHDAEDLVQETFVRAYQNLDRFREVQRFSTWLFTIASRLAISQFRKHREEKVLPEMESVHAGPLAELLQQETHQGLWQAAQELSANQFEVLWLKYSEGMAVKEIAQITGKTQVYVKVLLYRARTNLAKRLPGPTEEMEDSKVVLEQAIPCS